jgi:hypothetical protein
MPFSIKLTDTDIERIAQAWQSESGQLYFVGPSWSLAALRGKFIRLQWESSESPRPAIEIRWEISPPIVAGYFNFLGPDRKRFRRGRFIQMRAMDTIEEFEAALNRKGLDPRQFRSVADTYKRLLECLNQIPERDEIHELIGYDL